MAVAALQAWPASAQPSSVQPGVVERERSEAPQPRHSSGVSIPSIDQPQAWQDAQGTRFVLNRVDIDGNNALGDDVLTAPFNELLGKEVTVAQVFAATQAITRLYDAAGYALSLAYVPVQEVTNGVLLVRVIEGYIGEVRLNDTQTTRSVRWDEYVEKLKASRPLKSADLERYLLLISDLAGVRVTNFFERMTGGDPGAMRLVMTVERKAIGAHLEINNRGSKAIGPVREFMNLDLNGLLGADERLSLFAVTALDDNELGYFGGRLDMPLDSEGTVFSVEAARSETRPGTAALSSIAYEADGWTGSATFTHAFIRSLRENLYGSIGGVYKNLKSRILAASYSHDKLTAVAVTADYDSRAHWGGIWRIVATLFVGLDVFDATKEGDPLSSRADASGKFARLEASASHLVSLSPHASFFAEVAGQVADGPLLASEQCGYGGGYIGRAFDPFEVTGDHCVKGRAEFRFDFPLGEDVRSVLSNVQFYALADFGVMIKAGTLLPTEERVETAESIGIGLRFKARDYLSGYVEAVHPLGRGVALDNGSRDSRVFFGLSADY